VSEAIESKASPPPGEVRGSVTLATPSGAANLIGHLHSWKLTKSVLQILGGHFHRVTKEKGELPELSTEKPVGH